MSEFSNLEWGKFLVACRISKRAIIVCGCFKKFNNLFDNNKGQNNKGCGSAQFFHYFNEVEIISKGFDENKNYKRIHWKASKEKEDI